MKAGSTVVALSVPGKSAFASESITLLGKAALRDALALDVKAA